MWPIRVLHEYQLYAIVDLPGDDQGEGREAGRITTCIGEHGDSIGRHVAFQLQMAPIGCKSSARHLGILNTGEEALQSKPSLPQMCITPRNRETSRIMEQGVSSGSSSDGQPVSCNIGALLHHTTCVQTDESALCG